METQLLILRTNLRTRKKVRAVKPLLNHHPVIIKWSVDVEDVDNVLRIECRDSLTENEVSRLLRGMGFFGEPLPD